jgi:hypothetical protein
MLPPVGAATMGQMEIRIVLDRAEPPAGRLRAVPDRGHGHAGQEEEIRFTGWLGLLRALYAVTGGPGAGSVPMP